MLYIAGFDFLPLEMENLVFSPGNHSEEIEVFITVIDDNAVEMIETFSVVADFIGNGQSNVEVLLLSLQDNGDGMR